MRNYETNYYTMKIATLEYSLDYVLKQRNELVEACKLAEETISDLINGIYIGYTQDYKLVELVDNLKQAIAQVEQNDEQ